MIRVAEEERDREVQDSWQRSAFVAWLTTPNQSTFRDWLGRYRLLGETGKVVQEGPDPDEDRRKALQVVQSLLGPGVTFEEVPKRV